jgi:hypothetical protein
MGLIAPQFGQGGFLGGGLGLSGASGYLPDESPLGDLDHAGLPDVGDGLGLLF